MAHPSSWFFARIWALLLLAPSLLLAPAALASPAAACAAAYEGGQRSMSTAALLAAAKQFRHCASPACPEVMHAECLRFLDRVEAVTPSVVVRLLPEVEVPVHVVIDGGEEALLDGRAMALDPGSHQLRVRAAGYAVAERRFLLSEGEKLKTIEVRLTALPESAARGSGATAAATPYSNPTSPAEDRALVVPLVIGGAVISAGGAGFAYWGLRARSREDALDRCSPHCATSQVSDAKRDYLMANVSLAVGVSGLVGLAIWYASGEAGSTATRATQLPPAPRLTAGPTPLSLGFILPL
jgi:hypothetical protein